MDKNKAKSKEEEFDGQPVRGTGQEYCIRNNTLWLSATAKKFFTGIKLRNLIIREEPPYLTRKLRKNKTGPTHRIHRYERWAQDEQHPNIAGDTMWIYPYKETSSEGAIWSYNHI